MKCDLQFLIVNPINLNAADSEDSEFVLQATDKSHLKNLENGH